MHKILYIKDVNNHIIECEIQDAEDSGFVRISRQDPLFDTLLSQIVTSPFLSVRQQSQTFEVLQNKKAFYCRQNSLYCELYLEDVLGLPAEAKPFIRDIPTQAQSFTAPSSRLQDAIFITIAQYFNCHFNIMEAIPEHARFVLTALPNNKVPNNAILLSDHTAEEGKKILENHLWHKNVRQIPQAFLNLMRFFKPGVPDLNAARIRTIDPLAVTLQLMLICNHLQGATANISMPAEGSQALAQSNANDLTKVNAQSDSALPPMLGNPQMLLFSPEAVRQAITVHDYKFLGHALSDNFDINQLQSDSPKSSLIYPELINRNYAYVKFLIQICGLDINHIFEDGPLLTRIVKDEKLEAREKTVLVKRLLDLGANVNSDIPCKIHPFYWAAVSNNIQIVQLIVQHGGKPQLSDGNILYFAYYHKLETISQFLIKYTDVDINRKGDKGTKVPILGIVASGNFLMLADLIDTERLHKSTVNHYFDAMMELAILRGGQAHALQLASMLYDGSDTVLTQLKAFEKTYKGNFEEIFYKNLLRLTVVQDKLRQSSEELKLKANQIKSKTAPKSIKADHPPVEKKSLSLAGKSWQRVFLGYVLLLLGFLDAFVFLGSFSVLLLGITLFFRPKILIKANQYFLNIVETNKINDAEVGLEKDLKIQANSPKIVNDETMINTRLSLVLQLEKIAFAYGKIFLLTKDMVAVTLTEKEAKDFPHLDRHGLLKAAITISDKDASEVIASLKRCLQAKSETEGLIVDLPAKPNTKIAALTISTRANLITASPEYQSETYLEQIAKTLHNIDVLEMDKLGIDNSLAKIIRLYKESGIPDSNVARFIESLEKFSARGKADQKMLDEQRTYLNTAKKTIVENFNQRLNFDFNHAITTVYSLQKNMDKICKEIKITQEKLEKYPKPPQKLQKSSVGKAKGSHIIRRKESVPQLSQTSISLSVPQKPIIEENHKSQSLNFFPKEYPLKREIVAHQPVRKKPHKVKVHLQAVNHWIALMKNALLEHNQLFCNDAGYFLLSKCASHIFEVCGIDIAIGSTIKGFKNLQLLRNVIIHNPDYFFKKCTVGSFMKAFINMFEKPFLDFQNNESYEGEPMRVIQLFNLNPGLFNKTYSNEETPIMPLGAVLVRFCEVFAKIEAYCLMSNKMKEKYLHAGVLHMAMTSCILQVREIENDLRKLYVTNPQLKQLLNLFPAYFHKMGNITAHTTTDIDVRNQQDAKGSELYAQEAIPPFQLFNYLNRFKANEGRNIMRQIALNFKADEKDQVEAGLTLS